MEKVIKVFLKEDGNIDVRTNDELKFEIQSKNMRVTAEDIYTLLDYHPGDNYIVEQKTYNEQENKVVDFFAKLIKDIVEKIEKDD